MLELSFIVSWLPYKIIMIYVYMSKHLLAQIKAVWWLTMDLVNQDCKYNIVTTVKEFYDQHDKTLLLSSYRIYVFEYEQIRESQLLKFLALWYVWAVGH